jgi:hypothetical protein
MTSQTNRIRKIAKIDQNNISVAKTTISENIRLHTHTVVVPEPKECKE